MTSKTEPNEAESEAQKMAEEKARKEELVEAKMKMIRKKNEELMRRQKEIEEDRKNADVYSELVAIKKQHEHAASGVNKESSPTAGRGRGRGRGIMLQEMRKETLKAKQWEAKRKENVLREEQERKQGSRNSGSVSRFLVDDNRVDMSKTTGRNEHSWGGANFNKVVSHVQREKEGFRSGRNRDGIEMTMSGKERQQYREWKDERRKIDEERRARQKKSGNWSRTWDQRKVWDGRKKMWVFEDNDDNTNNTRWQGGHDNVEDWGNDNRSNNYRRDNRGDQGSRRGFRQQDNHETHISENWGESSNEEVAQNKGSGSKTKTETISSHQQHDAGMSLGEENWEEEVNVPITVEQKEESSDIVKEVSSEHPDSDAQPKPQRERKQRRVNDQCNNSTDNKKDQESVTDQEVTSDESHSEALQKELQERKQGDSVINKDSQEQHESATEDLSSSGETALHESPKDNKEPAVVEKDQLKNLHEESGAAHDDQEHADGDEKISDKVRKDDVKQASVSENQSDDKQVTTLDHSIQQIQTDEGGKTIHAISSLAEKANLPKLKVDKKVSFDTEENDQKTDSETKDDTGASVIDDIPPTPDFLKIDKDVDWGELEIDEEEVVERWS